MFSSRCTMNIVYFRSITMKSNSCVLCHCCKKQNTMQEWLNETRLLFQQSFVCRRYGDLNLDRSDVHTYAIAELCTEHRMMLVLKPGWYVFYYFICVCQFFLLVKLYIHTYTRAYSSSLICARNVGIFSLCHFLQLYCGKRYLKISTNAIFIRIK